MVPEWLKNVVKSLWMVTVFSVAAFVLVIAILAMRHFPTSLLKTATVADYDPCCGYPCLNQGVCMSWPDKSYSCDCTGTGYYGTHCQIPTWFTRASAMVKPGVSTMHTFLTGNAWLWAVLNRIPFVHKGILSYVYFSHDDIVDSPPTFESAHSFVTLDVYFNKSYYARALPPVPEHCPTPMGIKGHKDYPDIDVLIEKVFRRSKFIPEPQNSNVLFLYYAQHFTHQFFRTADSKNAPQLTNGTGGVDGSHIYGLTESDRQAFRSRVNGKLRTQVIDGEEFPPYLKDVPEATMSFPDNMSVTETEKSALGHPSSSLLPGLFVYDTIWMREHNRVCDELLKIHSDWSDEQLYHTARLIIIGEIIEITIADFVQHLSQYKLQLAVEPTLIHNTRFQFHSRIYLEFTYLFHWHQFNPDILKVAGTNYAIKEMVNRTAPVFKHGFDTFIHALISNRAGALTARNHNPILLHVLSTLLQNGRQLRIQGINAYRKRFNMEPFTSFEDMTGEKKLAAVLKELYGDIEAVELYVGLLAERPGPSVTPMGMVTMGGPWSFKTLLANPIYSPRYWKPSTFGGEMGMEIVKTASLKKLFCLNMKSECQDIGFTVPNK